MENILLPSTIEFLDTDTANVGKVIITPCHQGYGTTIGNALRRVLLSSLPGAAVESVKIEGVQHEFSAIEGVQEDVVEIILNLKQVAVRCFSDQPVTLILSKNKKGVVTAGDFDKNSDVEIVNPDLKIATITNDKINFGMEITVSKGRGYVSAAEKNAKNLDLGTILIDSLYTPIRDVGYNVELTRVGDVTDYEKLTLTVETNGTIAPKDAIVQATKILIEHFSLILNLSGEIFGNDENLSIALEDNKVVEVEEKEEKEEKVEKPKKKKSKKT